MEKILLVDDDEFISAVVTAQLSVHGYDIICLDKGENVESTIKAHPDLGLVILDIMLPDRSGLEILESIRKDYDYLSLPIILFTARTDDKDVAEGLKKGANDYMTKPFVIETAVARIRTQLKLKSLHKELIAQKQYETIHTMIVTYNHEINNPLTVAVGILGRKFEKLQPEHIEKAKAAVDRIGDIVKKSEILPKSPLKQSNTQAKRRYSNLTEAHSLARI